MHAMLLCAGLGTRLRPLTDERPKPLVPLVNRPLASFALEALARHGVRHVVANAHHLAAQIDPGLRPWCERLGLSLTTLVEREILGTGGGIRHALPHLGGGDFLVFNGDVLAAPDLGAVMAHHRATGAWMTMVLRDDPRAERAGVIEVTSAGRVVRMLNEGAPAAEPTTRALFTGIYVLSSAVADELPAEGCVVRHTLRRLLARGARVSGVVDRSPWYDLGTPAAYAEASFALASGTLPWPGWEAPPDGVVRGAGVRVAEGVTVGGPAVLGDGVAVTGEGTLTGCIAWDGATLAAPAARVIASRGHRVAIP
jgi:mannose-1-phosphate guanylyltransferase